MKKLTLLPLLLILTLISNAQLSTPEITLGSSIHTVKLSTDSINVTITLKSPNNRYLAIGFDAVSMTPGTDVFLWNNTSNYDYSLIGFGAPVADATGNQNWTIVSNTVTDTVRTIVAKRPMGTNDDFLFTNGISSINLVYSVGSNYDLNYHGAGAANRGTVSATFSYNPAVLAIPLSNQTTSANILTGPNFFLGGGSLLLASVVSTGDGNSIAGNTNATVFIEPTQPSTPGGQFVKRHFEITPVNNASNATGRVTLYFTQTDFDDFNAVSAIDLPTSPTDNIGKNNILVEKRPGTSNNGTGLPNTYTGTTITINPVDDDIVWNISQNRWEVTFDVTGFSGFFVKSSFAVLSLDLKNFSVTKQENKNYLQWQILQSSNINNFEVETSYDGINFKTIAIIPVTGSSNKFSYYDYDNSKANLIYYRLKIFTGNKISFSKVVTLTNISNENIVLYPNPSKDIVLLQLLNAEEIIGTNCILTDAKGSTLQLIKITARQQPINISKYQNGTYYIKFIDGKTLKLLKQ